MDRKIEIIIIALLLINIGATSGLLFGLFGIPTFFQDEVIIDLSQNITFDPYELDIWDHFTADMYTYEEFSVYAKEFIAKKDDLFLWAEQEGYEQTEDEYYHYLSKPGKCGFDIILKKRYCELMIIEIDKDIDTIEVLVAKKLEE